jgi:hypothetical protein
MSSPDATYKIRRRDQVQVGLRQHHSDWFPKA